MSRDLDLLVSQIEEKFGTRRAFAEVLGIDETNLSHKLKRQSGKFMKQLEEHGISIRGDQINQDIGSINQTGEKGEMIGNAGSIGTINEVKEGSVNSKLVQVLEKTVDSDKSTIKFLHEIIEKYRLRVEQLENTLKQHEEGGEFVRAEIVRKNQIIEDLAKALGEKASKKILENNDL